MKRDESRYKQKKESFLMFLDYFIARLNHGVQLIILRKFFTFNKNA